MGSPISTAAVEAWVRVLHQCLQYRGLGKALDKMRLGRGPVVRMVIVPCLVYEPATEDYKAGDGWNKQWEAPVTFREGDTVTSVIEQLEARWARDLVRKRMDFSSVAMGLQRDVFLCYSDTCIESLELAIADGNPEMNDQDVRSNLLDEFEVLNTDNGYHLYPRRIIALDENKLVKRWQDPNWELGFIRVSTEGKGEIWPFGSVRPTLKHRTLEDDGIDF